MAFTRPKSSIGAGPGDPLKPWNMRRSNGWTGSIIGGCWNLSAPAEAEERYYAMLDEARMAASLNPNSLRQTRGGSLASMRLW